MEEGESVRGQVGIKNCECGAAFCWQILGFHFEGFSHSWEALRCAFCLPMANFLFEKCQPLEVGVWSRLSFFWKAVAKSRPTFFCELPFLSIWTIPFSLNKLFHFHLSKFSFFVEWKIPFLVIQIFLLSLYKFSFSSRSNAVIFFPFLNPPHLLNRCWGLPYDWDFLIWIDSDLVVQTDPCKFWVLLILI